MDERVERFFADAGMHVSKMIDRKVKNHKWHLTDAQIKAGADALYWKIQGGALIKPINYASRVYELAGQVKSSEFDADEKLIRGAKAELQGAAEVESALRQKIRVLNIALARVKKSKKRAAVFSWLLISALTIYEVIMRIWPLWNK